MQSVDFEVIVVGAGPAGAMLTKELAKRKISVICIEREVEAGYPSKSTAGTPLDTFKIFNLPEDLGYEGLSGFRLYGPTESYVADFGRPFAKLFKFRELKQHLIKEAISLGAHTMFGVNVTGAIKKNGRISGVNYSGFEGDGAITANVVVDATGPEALLAFDLGLMPKSIEKEDSSSLSYFSKPKVGGAFEYFLANANPDRGKAGFFIDIFLGAKYTPGGYSWIFATGENEVKAGACKMNPTFTVPNEKSQKEYFQDLWNANHQIKDAQPFEVHLCPYRHWVIGGLKSATLDNFMAIGDAATKFQPVFGEGVRAAFYSAHFAADALEEAVKKKDYSKKMLELQDKLWKEKWGRNWDVSKIIFQILYHSSDEEIDKFIKGLSKLDLDTLWNFYLGNANRKDYITFFKSLAGLVDKATVWKLIKSI